MGDLDQLSLLDTFDRLINFLLFVIPHLQFSTLNSYLMSILMPIRLFGNKGHPAP
jgi:hypothetical protein